MRCSSNISGSAHSTPNRCEQGESDRREGFSVRCTCGLSSIFTALRQMRQQSSSHTRSLRPAARLGPREPSINSRLIEISHCVRKPRALVNPGIIARHCDPTRLRPCNDVCLYCKPLEHLPRDCRDQLCLAQRHSHGASEWKRCNKSNQSREFGNFPQSHSRCIRLHGSGCGTCTVCDCSAHV